MLQSKDRVAEWVRKPLHMLPTRDSLQIKRHTQTKRKGMEKDIALMDPKGVVLNEISQIEKDKYRIISHTCGI